MRRTERVKVGIDARTMGLQMGGGDVYSRNLVRTLPLVDPEIEYTLFLTPRQRDIALPGMEAMRTVVVGPDNLQLRIPFTLPLAAARAGVDVLHAHFLAPPLCPARIVLTVHDISYEHDPRYFSRGYLLQYRAIMPLMARHADAIVTISEFSRQDIIRRYLVPPERVAVAYGAVEPIFRPLRDHATLGAVREKYSTGERFILSVGEIQPRKNLKTLIEAYVRLRRADAIRHKLVLVGKRAWLSDETFAAARDSGYRDDLVFTGYVPDDDLMALYNAAELFVYPSLFEGFGLPPLEAMACGTPVITSNTSSLPEVVGDAGIMLDPRDVDALASAIMQTTADKQLCLSLSDRGIRQAQEFSWESTARKVAEVYRRVSTGAAPEPV